MKMQSAFLGKTRKAPLVFWSILSFLSFLLLFSLFLIPSQPVLAADGNGQATSMQMMERAETIVYGEPNRGGLIERLNSLERELFGRDLPGSVSERHAAILNFLEVGTPDQPPMLFRLGIVEWLIGEPVQARMGALQRVERLENELDGTMQYGRPLAMRIERLLGSLLPERITSQEAILPTATVLQAQFLEEVRNASARSGDRIIMALTNDLLVNNVLIAPRGSLIDASVRSVRSPGLFGRRGRINIDFHALLTLGAQGVPVTEGEASGRAAAGWTGTAGAGGVALGGALLAGPFGLVFGGLIRGDAVNINQGDIMFLETYGDVRVLGFAVPSNLRIDPRATVRETAVDAPPQPQQQYQPLPQPQVGEREIILLPPEHQIN